MLPSLAETAEFLALAGESDLIAGVVGWADLTSPAVPETLSTLRSGPGGSRLAGIRHLLQGEPDPRWLARPDVRRGLRAVAAAGLAYDLLTLPHQLPAAISTVRALPSLTFILDHLSKPPIASGELQPWAALIRELAVLPNVYCKLSGMVTEAGGPGWTVTDLRPYAETVLAAFGPSRVMFGSDWPVCMLAASYADVVSAARELAAGNSVGIDDTALLFAKLNLSGADGAISCWNDKYYWQFWRPISAIRAGDADGNPDTVGDPNWTPLFDPATAQQPGAAPLSTPPFPDHPSPHSCLGPPR